MRGILRGMRMTLHRALRPTVTELYPYERKTLPDRVRAQLAIRPAEDGSPDCRACGACAKACPDHAILIERDPEDAKRFVSMRVNHGKCTFCGLCVEACPAGLYFNQTFDFSHHEREGLFVTLIDAKEGEQ